MSTTLTNRHEVVGAYDIAMGNPNGDSEDNSPREYIDGGQFRKYTTDTRLKRFIRDYWDEIGKNILVKKCGGDHVDMTRRIKSFLDEKYGEKVTLDDANAFLADLKDTFIDVRTFGSTFACDGTKDGKVTYHGTKWPEVSPLTGPVQFSFGKALHAVSTETVGSTSVMSSGMDQSAGNIFDYKCVKYCIAGFCGIANEMLAKKSGMTDADMNAVIDGVWKGVRESNSRSKNNQVPRFIIDIVYKPDTMVQISNAIQYVRTQSRTGKEELAWESPEDYVVDLSELDRKLKEFEPHIEDIRYDVSSDLYFDDGGMRFRDWTYMNIDGLNR